MPKGNLLSLSLRLVRRYFTFIRADPFSALRFYDPLLLCPLSLSLSRARLRKGEGEGIAGMIEGRRTFLVPFAINYNNLYISYLLFFRMDGFYLARRIFRVCFWKR